MQLRLPTKEETIDYGTLAVGLIAVAVSALEASENVIPASYVAGVAAGALILSQAGSAIRIFVQFEQIQTLRSQLADATEKIKSLVSN